MNYNTENAKKIQEYIDSHLTEIEIDDKDPCNNTELIKLTQSDGTVKKQKIKVIKLPLELLFHNVRNGRFKDIYLETKISLQEAGHNGLESTDDPESWDLDPTNEAEAKLIRSMLLEQLDPEAAGLLLTAIEEDGQEEPGIITHDGYIINANRRAAILHILSQKDPQKFGFMKVAQLPDNIDPLDLYNVEINCQMGKDLKLDYSPINAMLKVKEGRNLGMSADTLAEKMGKSTKEIKHLEKMCSVAAKILEDHGTPNQYPLLKNRFAELDDLMRQVLPEEKQKAWGPEDFIEARRLAYDLFWYKDFHHKLYRKWSAIMSNPRVREHFLDSAKRGPKGEEFSLPQKFDSFQRATQALEAIASQDKPEKLLNSLLDSFQALSEMEDKSLLKKENSLKKIFEILEYLKELQKFRDENSDGENNS
jgi:hypothetical protein